VNKIKEVQKRKKKNRETSWANLELKINHLQTDFHIESGVYSDINSPSNLHEFESGMAQKGSVDQRFDNLEIEIFQEISALKWVIWDLQAYLDALIIGNQIQIKTGKKCF
jgi:hypothetical protein